MLWPLAFVSGGELDLDEVPSEAEVLVRTGVDSDGNDTMVL